MVKKKRQNILVGKMKNVVVQLLCPRHRVVSRPLNGVSPGWPLRQGSAVEKDVSNCRMDSLVRLTMARKEGCGWRLRYLNRQEPHVVFILVLLLGL